MTAAEVFPLPDWVRPAAAQVSDMEALARNQAATDLSEEGERVDGVLFGIQWVQGTLGIGPATSRPEEPVTRGMAIAEMYVAARICDGGGTPERQVRGAAEENGVRYYPADLHSELTPDSAYGLYQVLGWLSGCLDGWERGRTAPMDIPARDQAGAIIGDARSRELAALVEAARAETADRVAHGI